MTKSSNGRMLAGLLCTMALAAGCAHGPASAAAVAPRMQLYYFVQLTRGPSWSAVKTPETKRLLDGHMANLYAMAAAGKLVVAGPFDADDSERDAATGFVILDVADEAEAQALLSHDPAIAAGHLSSRILRWHGPAGLTYAGDPRAATARAGCR